MNTAAGWYPDPQDPNIHRWWDGTQWTHNTQAASQSSRDASPLGGRGAAIAAGILTGLGVITAFIPVLSFFAWALLLAGIICAIVALARRQRYKGLSIASLCVAPVAFVIAVVVSIATLAPFSDSTAIVPINAGPVVADNYKTTTERELALITKDPQPHMGEQLTLYATITQFDEATGDCTFRANVSHEHGEEAWDYDHNMVFTKGAADCAELGKYVEGDTLHLLATVAGSKSYSALLNNSITVPMLQIDRIDLI